MALLTRPSTSVYSGIMYLPITVLALLFQACVPRQDVNSRHSLMPALHVTLYVDIRDAGMVVSSTANHRVRERQSAHSLLDRRIRPLQSGAHGSRALRLNKGCSLPRYKGVCYK